MLGIGLGGFVDGFSKGYGLRQQMDEDKLRQQELDRAQTQRDRIDAISAETNEAFGAAVEAGEFDPSEFYKFWVDYALPRMRSELLMQGEYAAARQLTEWGESEAAKEGGRLFASAMFKAQTGNAAGALEDVIKAAQIEGYIEHGFELMGQDTITDADGNVLGYRLKIKDPDGNEVEQDIAVQDLPNMIATFANPEAAWASQQEARAAAAEREADLEDFRSREEIKREVSGSGDNSAELRISAIETLRERMAPDPLNPEAVTFDSLSAEEQDRLIQEEIDLQTGARTPPAPMPQVVVDQHSGQPVAPSQAASGQGFGLSPSSSQGGGGLRPPPPATNSATTAPNPAATPQPVPQGQSKTQMIDRAAQMMVQGGNPQAIARALTNAGIQPEEWPDTLRQASGVGGALW